jgi:hypothetical protein
LSKLKDIYQGCGSGLDPDSMTCVDPDSESGSRFSIRIQIRNPDPDPWARKMKKKNALFLNFLNIFIAKR